jgi:hypothetical protein
MKIIEFIGPQAIGKSTTFKAFMKMNIKNKFITEQQAYQDILNFRRKDLTLMKKLFYIILKFSLYKKLKNIGFSYLINSIKDNVYKQYNDLYEPIINSFFEGFNKMNDIPARFKIRFTTYYYKLIQTHILLKHTPINKIVVLEEGIIHNNFGIMNISDLSQIKHLMPELLICLKLEDQLYLKRRFNRDEKENNNRKFSHSDLTKKYMEYINKNDKKIEFFIENNIPCLVLNADDKPKDNAIRILKTLNTFIDY